MRAPRDIVKHVAVELTMAKRKCHGNKMHRIGSGERCVVVKEGSFAGSKNYCTTCARALLSAADARMKSLWSDLEQRSETEGRP